MTQTQPDPLLKKFTTQPNQPPLKTDPTWWVGLNWVGFGEFVAHPYMWLRKNGREKKKWKMCLVGCGGNGADKYIKK